jgi:predicted RNA binding protein YcfA (HicA-like mRNA interferase family)
MPKLKRLSGKEVITLFQRLGFEIAGRKGSHVKLRRIENGVKQTLTIPDHPAIDTGTLKAILRHASAYVPEIELNRLFMTQ